MRRMIQIRNVPDQLHRRLKARAAQEGLSLSDFLLREAELAVERPSLHDFLTRVRSHEPIEKPLDSRAAVRAEREGRR